MNLAIDVSTTAGFRTGTEEYIEGLVFGLQRSGVQVVGIGRRSQALLSDKPRLGLDIRPKPSVLRKLWWEYYGVRRLPPDVQVVHIPFMAHPTVRMRVPSVVTVHDLIPFRLTSYHQSWRERSYFRHVARSLPYADRLVAISQATLSDLATLFPSLVPKAVVIPNGVHPEFYEKVPAERVARLTRRFALRQRPRVLYVGGYDERKNVKMLLKAMALAFAGRREGELVLVGAEEVPEVRRWLDEVKLTDRTILTPFVSREELVALYSDADVFVYPSRYEGFGMPPAQALAVGVPVVASDIPPVREVIQHFGVLVDPDSVEAWTVAVQRAMDSPAAMHQMVIEGQSYAERFSWRAIALQYKSVYQDAIQGRQL